LRGGRILLLMQVRVSEATSAFLEVAADDLQRQLGASSVVVEMRVEEGDGRLTIIATLRIGHSLMELFGSGDNLVTAYSDLHLHVAEPILAAAYREVLGSLTSVWHRE